MQVSRAALDAKVIWWNIVEELLQRWPRHLRWSLCPWYPERLSDFEDFSFIGKEGDYPHPAFALRQAQGTLRPSKGAARALQRVDLKDTLYVRLR